MPSECVLYFVRRLSLDHDQNLAHDLFIALRARVLGAVPVRRRRIVGSDQLAENAFDLNVQEAVLQKFQELLCGDRGEYDERLDFFECRFNMALALLRSTARRDVCRKESRYRPLSLDGDPNELSKEVEAALGTSKLRWKISSTQFTGLGCTWRLVHRR